jgi:pimeloyl-ACP methyl ester carboxylesterase
VAIRAAAEHKIAPDRLILAAPAVWGWSTIPKTYGAVLWLAAHTAPGQIVRPSKNIKIVASDNNKILYENWLDPLFQKNTRIDSVYGLVELMEDAADSVGKLPPNTLYLYGAKDQVIPPAATLRAARRLPPSVRSIYYPDGYHMLTRDLHGPLVWADILSFIENPDAPPPSGLGPLPNAPKSPMQFVEKKPEIAPASPEKTPQSTPMAAAKDPAAGASQGNP